MEPNLIFLDGAMGTMLQAAGLKLGQRPELLNLTEPETIAAVHRQYIEAGSDIIYANTFGANRHKLAGTGGDVAEVVSAGIAIAKKAADGKAKVALDVGPIGELLEPLGSLEFEEAYEIYREMVIAGEKAGADLVIFETMTDLYEVKAAVLAAKENTSLPVWVTMSFEANGRTFTGTTVPSMAMTLTGLGVDALGINCSLGPKEIYPLAKELARWTGLPLIVKANAGLPDPETGNYSITAEDFAREMAPILDLGVAMTGGCCGTSPAFIAAMKKAYDGKAVPRRQAVCHGVCSAGEFVELNGVRVIGERINPTGKKRFQQALREGDLDYILRQGVEQADVGADILDVNVGLPGVNEAELMVEVVKGLQSVLSLPLQIDSSDPAAIEAGLRACNGKAIVNSVNGKAEVLDTILPIVKKYGAAVVGLTMDETGIPQTAEERFAIAKRILEAALAHGIPREDVYIDCLALTVSAQQEQAVETLKAVEQVHRELGLHCVLGVSNISFGLPQRERITESFLTQALHCGLDLPILNPNQTRMMDCVACYKVLSGEDQNCGAYISRFSGEAAPAAKETRRMDISEAISRGLKEETGRLAAELLNQKSELALINEDLIPALDKVGENYEKNIIFLPQLINAANAANAAFELIKTRLANSGGGNVSRGKVLLATVEGDIHDIGKNIVKVILENYGYQVIDLGRDVPSQKVVETAIRENIRLVGLSALMTTTVPSMEKTIAALRESGHNCKVMVGGAVLTTDYAQRIGADYYAKDAKRSADIAREVLG